MKRYHKKIGFPAQYNSRLNELTEKFNSSKQFKKSNHAIEQLKTRFNFLDILKFLLESIEFKTDDIFEYYVMNDEIIKICYKMEYNRHDDLIIVLTNEKAIVTVYLNSKGDNHKTLDTNLYQSV